MIKELFNRMIDLLNSTWDISCSWFYTEDQDGNIIVDQNRLITETIRTSGIVIESDETLKNIQHAAELAAEYITKKQ